MNGISSGYIAAWCGRHESAIGDQLKEQMKGADRRNEMLSDLSKLKSDLAACKEDPAGWKKVAADMDDLKHRYPELGDSLDVIKNEADFEIQKHCTGPTATVSVPTMTTQSSGWGVPSIQFGTKQTQIGATGKYDDDHEKGLIADDIGPDGKCGSALDGVMDSIRNTDQLEMINIQDLASKYQNAENLASNLMSSVEKGISNAIGNIRG